MKQYAMEKDLVHFLSNVSLFKKADQSVLNHLAEKTVFSSYDAGQTIIHKGEIGDVMYIIFSGSLKVHDGDHQVAELKKGDFFGELSLLDSEPRSMSVTALDPAVLGSLSRTHFYEVLHEFPEITSDIIAVLNKRLRNQNEVLIGEFKTREAKLTDLVDKRTKELALKNQELEMAMEELKKSQQQLIQSEKLASLGQLTAGIAHEIKNPLNFVNNFSQLSVDLFEELKEARTDEDRAEIMAYLETNIAKINQHGKQADSIVKNMLEHTRSGTGTKQATNINQLCQEYLHLAYYSMQGNNPGFDCEIIRELGNEIPELNVVSKDIAKVLLNIFNNAFYSVHHKRKMETENFKPVVSLVTETVNGHINIKIHDNGTGIPETIKDKIFQPFFTTKPAGQGTGLGLSLSYDIIHASNGKITVESTEGKGAGFIVTLPLN